MIRFAELIAQGRASEGELLDAVKHTIQAPNFMHNARWTQDFEPEIVPIQDDTIPQVLVDHLIIYTKDFPFGRIRVITQVQNEEKRESEVIDFFVVDEIPDPLEPPHVA